MSMLAQHMEDARSFLDDLANSPPLLPCEPDLLPRLFKATREDSTLSAADLAALIERSQKLASRVLSIANSACYALESSITSLQRAVSVLGFNEVRSLTLMAAASAVFEGAKMPKDFNCRNLWRHHLLAAALAKALSAALRGADGQSPVDLDPDEAYVTGLLHDIGKELLAAKRPAVWEAVEDLRRETGLSFTEAENEYWGMDHSMFGARMLEYWKLPLLLTDTISWHHAPDLAPTRRAEAALLAAANRLANEGLGPDGEIPAPVLALLPAGADPAKLAAAAQKALSAEKAELLAGMVG